MTVSTTDTRTTPWAPMLAAALLCAAAGTACANDRPYQQARTAVLEDEEYVWSVDTWTQRYGKLRGLSFEPEYTFGGGNSIQVEFTRLWGRDGAESAQEAEVELKHVFNNIARDGWGWAVSAAFDHEREIGGEGGTARGMQFRVPVSVALGDSTLLHINPGIAKRSGERRNWTFSVGAEHQLTSRWMLFSELSRDGDERYGAVGLRHWVRKEKVAVDFTLQQYRNADGSERASGFILAMSLYDL